MIEATIEPLTGTGRSTMEEQDGVRWRSRTEYHGGAGRSTMEEQDGVPWKSRTPWRNRTEYRSAIVRARYPEEIVP